MDAISSLDCIDPTLNSIELLGLDGPFDMVSHNQPSTLASDFDLDLILGSMTIPSNVRRDPTDGVWNTADQEENIHLLRRNSILVEFPFPPLPNPSNDDKRFLTQELTVDSCSPPVKRQRRRRKAPLSQGEKEDKRKKFLEKNRIAASKCRSKKKTEIEGLEDRKIALERENTVLKKVVHDLWAELRLYRDAVMTHAVCNHPDISEWSERSAHLSAVIDSFCQSLVDDADGGGDLDNRGGLEDEEARSRASRILHIPRCCQKMGI